MKAQPTTKQLIEMLYERLPELFDRAGAQPAPDCKETGVCIQTGLACFGQSAQPAPVPMAHIVGEIDHNGKVWTLAAVPDAFGTREGEHPQYIQGWNDCRAETLKMRKP
jgi:hypothetical protein